MDEIDRAILRELQIDGRIAYAELGPKVGLSASAARQRLQRLLDSQAVQVVGVTDPMGMGGQAMALLGIAVDGDPRAVADALAERAEVVYAVLTSGASTCSPRSCVPDRGICWTSSTTSYGRSRASGRCSRSPTSGFTRTGSCGTWAEPPPAVATVRQPNRRRARAPRGERRLLRH